MCIFLDDKIYGLQYTNLPIQISKPGSIDGFDPTVDAICRVNLSEIDGIFEFLNKYAIWFI
ncbi:MAG: hypothetical protein OXE92_03075 [Bacteroidetes bacterium]|nr:hypothetical protein [Bacteroidota bacterium]MCY4204691.1 hypothetical protein [Bacteroidota bacterium]